MLLTMVFLFADILSHMLASDETKRSNEEARASHRVVLSALREAPSLRLSNYEPLPTVLNDDELFLTVCGCVRVFVCRCCV